MVHHPHTVQYIHDINTTYIININSVVVYCIQGQLQCDWYFLRLQLKWHVLHRILHHCNLFSSGHNAHHYIDVAPRY
jgi:hypothetical protein